jgi:hypothetical protein
MFQPASWFVKRSFAKVKEGDFTAAAINFTRCLQIQGFLVLVQAALLLGAIYTIYHGSNVYFHSTGLAVQSGHNPVNSTRIYGGSAAPSRAQDLTVATRPGATTPRTRVQIASGQSVLALAVRQRDACQVARVRPRVGVLRHVPDPRSGTVEAAPHGRAQAGCRKAGVDLRTFECGLPVSPAAMLASRPHPQPPAIAEGTDAETRAHRSRVGQ